MRTFRWTALVLLCAACQAPREGDIAAEQQLWAEATNRENDVKDLARRRDDAAQAAVRAAERAEAAESRRAVLEERVRERLREVEALERTERDLRARADGLVSDITRIRPALTAVDQSAVGQLTKELAATRASKPRVLTIQAVRLDGSVQVLVPSGITVPVGATLSVVRADQVVGTIQLARSLATAELAEQVVDGRFLPAAAGLTALKTDQVRIDAPRR